MSRRPLDESGAEPAYIGIKIPRGQRADLERLAAERGVKLSALVREGVGHVLELANAPPDTD